MTTWSVTPNEYCLMYDCAYCPMRRGYWCFYEELKGDVE